jgi:hypothetical protein
MQRHTGTHLIEPAPFQPDVRPPKSQSADAKGRQPQDAAPEANEAAKGRTPA